MVIARTVFSALLLLTAAPRGAAAAEPLRFEISFAASARGEPADGRVFVIVARSAQPEPRLELRSETRTSPFFARNVDGLRPGQPVTIDDTADGYPLERLRDLPAGDYWVQALFNVYTTFHRADGHTVKMHMDQWEGQRFEISPGNLYSEPRRMRIDPAASGVVRITLDRVIPAVAERADTEYVKRVKFQSPLLSRFWGRPIYIGATVLLPRDYATNPGVRYPVHYEQGHFSTAAPGRFGERAAPTGAPESARERARSREQFEQAWLSDGFPRLLYVTFQHPTPYYDDSYAVDSPNSGPYGRAIVEELIPYVEEHFRAIRQPWARVLSGGSTGGWEALALQIFHPEFFGGTYSYCPDPVDFHAFQIVNVYEWANAWHRQENWVEVPLPGQRDVNGVVIATMKQQLTHERAMGDRGRSGEQWDAWQATYGPLGDDGYFKPIFDPKTGAIDREVAEYYREHMDLAHHLRTHWERIGAKLAGKLHVWIGDMDSYYLNNAVYRLEDYLKTTSNPPWGGTIVYGPRKPHCWSGPLPLHERIKGMAQDVVERAPRAEDRAWWGATQ
jgi:hypothetical protein